MGIRVEPLCVVTPLRGYQPLRPNLVVILSTLLSDHPFRGHISLQTNWRFLEKASVVLKAHSHVTSVFALLFDLCCTVLENANIKHTRSQSKNRFEIGMKSDSLGYLIFQYLNNRPVLQEESEEPPYTMLFDSSTTRLVPITTDPNADTSTRTLAELTRDLDLRVCKILLHFKQESIPGGYIPPALKS